MKAIKLFFVFALVSMLFASCSKDEVTKEEGLDMASEVAGVYKGTVISDDLLIIDTYEISVKNS